jgi:asparaginyl-tRNA synthetase
MPFCYKLIQQMKKGFSHAEHVSVSQISKYVGRKLPQRLGLSTATDKGKLCFLLLRDGSGFIQCVASKVTCPRIFDKIIRLPKESSVIVTGAGDAR